MRTIKQLKWSYGVAILAVLGLLYFVLYSLLVPQPPPGLTEIYFADRITDAHRILIDRYNTLNAGRIRVIPVDFPNLDFSTNERKEILARSLRGAEDGLDLMAVDIVWVKRFARWCEPLGKYFTAEELKRIVPDALYSCQGDTELLAVPLDMVQSVLYYREDLVKSLPGGEDAIRDIQANITWPDFLRLRHKFGYKGPFYVFPAADYEGFICNYIENLLSLKPDYFATYGFNFDTPDGKEALQQMVDLLHRDGAAPAVVTSFTEAPSYEYFIKNDGLFLRGWTTYDKDFSDQPVDREKQQHMRKAPLPHFPGGKPALLFGGWNLMMSRFSKKKDAVVDFVKFLLRDDSQEVFYSVSRYYPIVTSFYQDSASIRKYPEIADIRELLKSGVHRPAVKDYTNYSKIMSHYFSLAIRNKITVDEAVERATRDINADQSLAVAR
jgi:multiple sugar transport system substrate-binding protein